jgi:hypothetical protein
LSTEEKQLYRSEVFELTRNLVEITIKESEKAATPTKTGDDFIFCGKNKQYPASTCSQISSSRQKLAKSDLSLAAKQQISDCLDKRARAINCGGKSKSSKEVAKISGSKSLPLSDKTDWDGDAAEQAMRKKAGGPKKEDINWSDYGKGFVYVNADDPKNFTSYKLPFADVIGGTLKAVKGGVYAAMAAVTGARGGVEGVDKKKAYNFLSSYYKKFDEEPPEFNE